MAIRSHTQRLQQLREREAQLAARRRQLEAVIAKDAEKRALRGAIVVGKAVLEAMRANPTAAVVLPQRLLPFVNERDRALAKEAFDVSTPYVETSA